MMERLQGQRILVTGAARGLGAVFCHAIVNAGGTVLALGRDEAALLAMLDGCKAAHDGAHEIIIADVSDRDAVQAALAGRQFKGLVNNAGIAMTATLRDSDADEARRVIDTNFLGSLWMLQACAPILKAVGGGVMVNVASVLGHRPLPFTGVYAATKAAVMQMTRSAAIELARDNIRVNALAPGYVMTDLNRDFLLGDAGQKLQSRTALRRFATPDELIPALLLLLDPANSYMTGEVLTIDGGMGASL